MKGKQIQDIYPPNKTSVVIFQCHYLCRYTGLLICVKHKEPLCIDHGGLGKYAKVCLCILCLHTCHIMTWLNFHPQVVTSRQRQCLYQLLKFLQVTHNLKIVNKEGFWRCTQRCTKLIHVHWTIFFFYMNVENAPLVVVQTGCPGTPAACRCVFSPCETSLCHQFGNTFSWYLAVQVSDTVWHLHMLITTSFPYN